MHPMFTYLDYKKAAIAALMDYGNQAIILEHADTLKEHTELALTSTPTASFDEMPKTGNPKAVENKIIGTISKLDELADRKKRAQAYIIRLILENPLYIGAVLSQKYRVPIAGASAQLNEGEEPQYLTEDHHEPIIDHDLFEKVQQESCAAGKPAT